MEHLFFPRYESSDSKTPAEIALIDLQGTQLGRVGIELVYFIISSSSPEQRVLHFDRLMHLYYDTFCSELEQLQFEGIVPFTYEELLVEYDSCYAFGFGLGCMHIQVKYFVVIPECCAECFQCNFRVFYSLMILK